MSLYVASTNSSVSASNGDGWDIYRSDNIVIQDSYIDNTDDCVSFKPNATNILIQGLYCTGSHGISVGSLGQYPAEYDIVENIYVYNISMNDASDGARIKVWPGISTPFQPSLSGGGGAGYVKNVTYDLLHNNNNDYAIEIDQCYGQSNQTLCNMYPSNMTISDVLFKDFSGVTSTTYDPEVGTLVCSSTAVSSAILACCDCSLADHSAELHQYPGQGHSREAAEWEETRVDLHQHERCATAHQLCQWHDSQLR